MHTGLQQLIPRAASLRRCNGVRESASCTCTGACGSSGKHTQGCLLGAAFDPTHLHIALKLEVGEEGDGLQRLAQAHLVYGAAWLMASEQSASSSRQGCTMHTFFIPGAHVLDGACRQQAVSADSHHNLERPAHQPGWHSCPNPTSAPASAAPPAGTRAAWPQGRLQRKPRSSWCKAVVAGCWRVGGC